MIKSDMDVELHADVKLPTNPRSQGPGARLLRRKRRFDPDMTWIDRFGEWQAEEVLAAQRYAECGRLSVEQLEEIYQETVIALMGRRYDNEDHARQALRLGIKHRAQHLYRDEHRRQEILSQAMTLESTGPHSEDSTERTALIREDRMVVAEFLTELNPLEQKVFWLQAEGMKYRSIAKALGLEINTARNATRSCERKREHFQILYDTGRLCGYRAKTIHALQNGKATSDDLARRAFAHLESCSHCRAEHQTNAQRLRRAFQGQAAALLPVPVFLHKLGWLTRLDHRYRTLQHRLTPNGVALTPGGVRERMIALIVGAGATAKVTATVLTVAVIAGGTLGISHSLRPSHTTPTEPLTSLAPTKKVAEGSSATRVVRAGGSQGPHSIAAKEGYRDIQRRASSLPFGPGQTVPYPSRRTVQRAPGQHESLGLRYLGVTRSSTMPHNIPTADSPPDASVSVHGGPFTP
jgi:RNA polymerase sigma factor (sigma-70 family)